ncbi:MAG TPA: glycosyltransferase, partial [Propionibacteriaceae bacterium]
HAHSIGLPIRRAITDLDRAALRGEARIGFDLNPDLPTLLVSGGSQGALQINTAVAGAWPDLLAQGIQVLHVLGPKNFIPGIERSVDERTGAVYQPLAYVEHMERAYAAADLMLARSGANTVLETAAVRLPAVFVPYPHGNGEQALNAELVVNAGGGIMLADSDCTPIWVGQEIPTLLAHPDRLAGMTKALAGVARLDAATVLASRVLEVIR